MIKTVWCMSNKIQHSLLGSDEIVAPNGLPISRAASSRSERRSEGCQPSKMRPILSTRSGVGCMGALDGNQRYEHMGCDLMLRYLAQVSVGCLRLQPRAKNHRGECASRPYPR